MRMYAAGDAAMADVTFTGRFDFSDPKGPWFAWSASTISARFRGTGIKSRLRSPGDNYFTVLLDGKVAVNSLHVRGIESAKEADLYTLATGLADGIHKISLVKRTEFNIGKAQFLGFKVENGSLLEPAATPERKIEIIGDSISCGFGVEGDLTTDYDPKYDNAFASYGVLAAGILDAECYDISCSGYGIIREYTGNRENILPNVYSLILPGNQTEWDFKSWIPQVVVINLGTNDFSFGFIPERAEFVEGYINFITRIRKNYPGVQIICTVGPIVEGDALEITREYISNGIVGYFRSCRQEWVHFLDFGRQKEADGYGITNHPSTITHRKMADTLADKIRTILG